MADSILKKISAALSKEVKAGEKNTPPEGTPAVTDESKFSKFVKTVEKEFGPDSVIQSDSNGVVLRIWLSRDAYTNNQKLFRQEEMQRWINGNGMLLLTAMNDVEPVAVKLYFTEQQNQGPEPKDDPRSVEKKYQKPVGPS